VIWSVEDVARRCIQRVMTLEKESKGLVVDDMHFKVANVESELHCHC